MSQVQTRRLLFFVDVTSAGTVVARGMNNDIEITSDNLADLREALVDELDRLGLDWRIVGIRADASTARA